MSEVSGPWDGSPGTFGESQWSDMFSHLLPSGVFGNPSTTDLLPYADSSGMHVKVRIGYGFVGGQYYQNTAEKTVNVDNGDANDRIDLVVLTRDPSTNTIVAGIHKGTAAAIPSPPVLTTNEIPLAQVLVKATRNTSIAVSECTDYRLFCGRTSRPVFQTPGGRPQDMPGLNEAGGDLFTTPSGLWFYSSDANDFIPVQSLEDTGWLACGIGAGWAGTSPGTYPPTIQARQLNGVVYVRGYPVKATAGAVSTDYTVATLPGLITNPPYTHRWASISGGTDAVDAYIFPNGVLHVLTSPNGLLAAHGFPVDTSYIVD